MNTKKAVISSLILSHVLTPFSHAELAKTSYQMGEFNSIGSLNLTAPSVNIAGENYRITIELEQGSFIGERFDNGEKTTFEYIGAALLYKDDIAYIPGDHFDDGKMVFQLSSSNDKEKTYKGLGCNSTFTACADMEENQKLELSYNKETNIWKLSMRTIITGPQRHEIDITDIDLVEL